MMHKTITIMRDLLFTEGAEAIENQREFAVRVAEKDPVLAAYIDGMDAPDYEQIKSIAKQF